FAHFSRHVRRGAHVFATDGVGNLAGQGGTVGVTHTGFRNPNGGKVMVLTNRGPEKSVQLVLGSQTIEIDLPADSVHTLEWA
ncbi:MAG: glycoside hydrolase family 30 beta sandwich domain-containing protein, partial [Acidobacteriota bacterium]